MAKSLAVRGKLDAMSKLTLFLLLMSACLAGCSQHAPPIKTMTTDSNGIKIDLMSDPDPPLVGANKFIIRLTDDTTGAPIVNANVTISAYNALAGGGDRESGRSKGDGTYEVPITLAIPDSYKLDVEVQRPSQDDSDAEFDISVG
jgi:hypothetical protein